mgnify:CR=1 FL=1
MPKKMTNRYDRIRGQTSAGTDRSVFIASSSRKAAAKMAAKILDKVFDSSKSFTE